MNDLKMTDAISRSAVLDRLEMFRRNYGLKAGYRDAMTDAIGEVSNALTVDAVPVVRCEDCKYRCTIVCPMFHTEYSWDTDDGCDCYDVDRTDDDGFCHLGERWECEEDD